MVLNNLFSGQQWRKRHIDQICGHEERGGEGETYGESNMETHITICKTDSQWEFAVLGEGNLVVTAPTTKSHQQI